MDEGEEDEDSHYYESGNVPDEDEEENHLYDDITEYHRVCDLDHEKNGYESGLWVSYSSAGFSVSLHSILHKFDVFKFIVICPILL